MITEEREVIQSREKENAGKIRQGPRLRKAHEEAFPDGGRSRSVCAKWKRRSIKRGGE